MPRIPRPRLRARHALALALSFLALAFWLVLPGGGWLQPSALAESTFTVTTTNDDGPGSLRQAITDANASPGTDTITFNIPGSGLRTITPASALPEIVDPVIIDGYTQPGSSPNTLAAGDDAVLLIELDGTLSWPSNGDSGFSGLSITGGSSTVRGLIINRFAGYPIYLGDNGANVIEGNFIGTDQSGSAAMGNGAGILLGIGADNNLIGGTTPAARNVISGNHWVGIFMQYGGSNKVQGNFIGTNASGTAALGNEGEGISVQTSGNLIGGAVAGARNIISGHKTYNGIYLAGSSGSSGIHNTVQGNYIGTDVTGTQAIGNYDGVNIIDGSGDEIGGDTAEKRNLISGNLHDGLVLTFESSFAINIRGNFIGTTLTGTEPLGNARHGISLEGARYTTIGGGLSKWSNTIAFNGGSGVNVAYRYNPSNNSIRGNSIFSNAGLGINFNEGGIVTANDPGDTDSGANDLQNFPVITSVVTDADKSIIQGTLNSTPNTGFLIDFYTNGACDPSGNGEGATYIVSVRTTTNASGDASFSTGTPYPIPVGKIVTATATSDVTRNTSEFSACSGSGAVGSVQFSSATYSTSEDAGVAVITLERTGGSSGPLTVNYTATDGTAASASDYTTDALKTVTFNDGETSKTFTINIVEDTLDELNETVNLQLSSPAGAPPVGSRSVATLTIMDDDAPPALSINDVNVTEGDAGTTNANFQVTLSAPSGRSVDVNYATVNKTAVAARDYLAATGKLTFAPGETSRTITVRIIGDTSDEANETLAVNLSLQKAATLADSSGMATIIDNDKPPRLSISDVSIVEGNAGTTNAIFKVSLTAASYQTITVKFATANGTATVAGNDYVAASGSLSFAPGQTTKTITVQVKGDRLREANETLKVSLTAPSNATISDALGIGTILNND